MVLPNNMKRALHLRLRLYQPFALTRFVQGLTVGTVYWFDLANFDLAVAGKFTFNMSTVILEVP